MESKAQNIVNGVGPFRRESPPTSLIKSSMLCVLLGIAVTVFSLYMSQYLGFHNMNISATPVVSCASQKRNMSDEGVSSQVLYNSSLNSIVDSMVEEPSILDSFIISPVGLMHNMTEKELFWRASFAPRIKEYPFSRVPKVAFMFLTLGPLPLAPIWEKFFYGHGGLYSVYTHALPSYRPDFAPTSPFYRRQIPGHEVAEWGEMSIVDAQRRLLANALLDPANERFVFLSESCIPIRNFSTVYSYLIFSMHSFISAFDDIGPEGSIRYNENMAPEIHLDQWRKGDQWFELNREVAVTVVKDDFYYPKFNSFCPPTCYNEEHYFPTMLSIVSPHLLANRSVMWIEWLKGGLHPATFGLEDVSEKLFRKMNEGNECSYNGESRSICYLFARRFLPDALEPLLLYLGPKL